MAALVEPTLWITKEQEPKPVGMMWRRLLPHIPVPPVAAVNVPRDVQHLLDLHSTGPIVLDSLTAFGLRDALLIAHMLVNWCQDNNERVLAVLQVTKSGDSAGYMEIPHLFDTMINLSPDPWGVRAFRVLKSRWSALESVYWSFDADGRIDTPAFPAAYSVEGKPGQYWLHPFPLSGAKWAGMLDVLQGNGKRPSLLRPGIACAAVAASYMDQGFLLPMDDHERRRFAEANGLTWLTPADAHLLLLEEDEDDVDESPIIEAAAALAASDDGIEADIGTEILRQTTGPAPAPDFDTFTPPQEN
jgi:hypothetical protein